MSTYDPDPVFLSSTYDTVLLSQRDLSFPAPINFVTAPGVSISAACFGHLSYEDGEFRRCFSNLLAVGFRRFEVDIYWDQSRSTWSFCPVAFPSSVPNVISSATSTTLTASPSSRTSSAVITSAVLSGAQLAVSTATNSTNATMTVGKNSSSTITSTEATAVTLPSSSNQTVISIGPYSCTTSINLPSLAGPLLDYIVKTENTLQANLLFFVINFHAAASASSPLSPAAAPTNLPNLSSLVGNILWSNLSAFTYSPDDLRADRANLNNSFFKVSERYRPTLEYYNVSSDVNGIFSTVDGWPSESFIELGNSKGKRLLLEIGNVDPQMASYNFTAEQGVLFSRGYIQEAQNHVAANSEGSVTAGCYFDPAIHSSDVSNTNSSWATNALVSGFSYPTSPSADLTPVVNLVTNLTDCGISPILNVTLLNATADQNFIPYHSFAYSSVWTWAPGEPKNHSSEASVPDSLFRCAATSPVDGRFRVQDCSNRNYAACRASPYNWTVSSSESSFSFASAACDENYIFGAPLTALENSYLTLALRASAKDLSRGVWVDFNSLQVQGCWTTGGSTATCPYAEDVVNSDRTILVPTVAASRVPAAQLFFVVTDEWITVIVLVLSALTVFSKVAGNRKVRKRTKKRVVNGFVYEGVPS